MDEKGKFVLRPIGRILDEDEPGDDEDLYRFWFQKQVFTSERHCSVLRPCTSIAQTWRMKERMKTVSVALVLCLNIGVDPPDTVKISPCARQQCWIDTSRLGEVNGGNVQKPIEIIGAALQKQYERWQPKARYKLSLDPTTDDIKKLCQSLRRNAKDERVLFHYNGHGVPKPTSNGEIWVFNKHYTQYIPLSVCDLQIWMGSPSIYVFDCSNAGNVVEYLNNPHVGGTYKEFDFANEDHLYSKDPAFISVPPSISSPYSYILLAACQASEILPLCQHLPADLFTSCLTTPIKVALKWYALSKSRKIVPSFTVEMADQIPGLLNDRRTMLGELNWIFTAVTDTIAWNTLSRELFQKLFRQDLLVASLFRNFLLAEKVLNFYNCSPISIPRLPSTRHHFMWLAWEYALDGILQQLPKVLEDSSAFQHSPFFSDQLTGFELWLDGAINMKPNDQSFLNPPEQLPIVLQVLLSQVHRQRALQLLGRFLDLGQWAVNLALSVGIFPYVLKLLQSSARELRTLLVFIWAKLLAVDNSCQSDLVKDNGHKYFIDVLSDISTTAECRQSATFVLSLIVCDFPAGQEMTVKSNVISLCLDQLQDPSPLLRMWLLLCLAKVWNNYDAARWRAVRDSAHEKVFSLLSDPVPEVRAAAVYSLGTFIANQTERVDQVIKLDQLIASHLLSTLYDASHIVRKELAISLIGYVNNFTMQMEKIALESLINKTNQSYYTVVGQNNLISGKFQSKQIVRSTSATDLTESTSTGTTTLAPIKSSNAAIKVWNALMVLKNDPQHQIAKITNELCDDVKKRANEKYVKIQNRQKTVADGSNPNTSRKTLADAFHSPLSYSSTFFQWSCRLFSEANTSYKIRQQFEIPKVAETSALLASPVWYEKDYIYNRAARILMHSKSEFLRAKCLKCDELLFSNKFNRQIGLLRFHPFDTQLAIVEEVNVQIYDWDTNSKLATVHNNKPHTRITYLEFINAYDNTLLITGTNESVVKVFKNYSKSDGGELVSCWVALNDLIPMSNNPGMIMEWDERSRLLYAAGNVNYIRLWDVNVEMKKLDLSLASSGNCASSLTSMESCSDILVAGCIDGSVRLFDHRLPKQDNEVRVYRDHSSRIVKVQCLMNGDNDQLLVAGQQGEIIHYDIRMDHLINKFQCSGGELRGFDAHKIADLLVSCNNNHQSINAFKRNGDLMYNIKLSQGIISKSGFSSYLSFHPYKVKLGVTSGNNIVYVYSLPDSKKK